MLFCVGTSNVAMYMGDCVRTHARVAGFFSFFPLSRFFFFFFLPFIVFYFDNMIVLPIIINFFDYGARARAELSYPPLPPPSRFTLGLRPLTPLGQRLRRILTSERWNVLVWSSLE